MHGNGEHGNADPLSYDEVLIVKVHGMTDVRLTKICYLLFTCLGNPGRFYKHCLLFL